jgi:urease accessory protein
MNPNRFSLSLRWFSLALFAAAPTAAFAHPGGSAGGFFSGLAHPLGGLDHIGAMVAVGLWAAQRGGRAIWTIPLAFISVMAVGGALGMAGVSMPFVEQGIAASVLVLGLLIAAAAQLPLFASAALVALFALFHGHSHGTEMPVSALGAAYGVGFLFATAMLHGAGIAMGLVAKRLNAASLIRFAGGAVAACGLYLLAV